MMHRASQLPGAAGSAARDPASAGPGAASRLAGVAAWVYLRMECELHSTELLLEALAARRQFRAAWLRRDYQELDNHLRDLLSLEPALLFASVYEPDGTLRAILPEDPIRGQNFAFCDGYRGVTARRAFYVGEVYRTAAPPTVHTPKPGSGAGHR